MKGEMIMGRQIAWIIYDYFKISEQEGALLEFKDLLLIKFKSNLKGFIHEWDMTLLGINDTPKVEILESLFRQELEKDNSIKDIMHQYEQDFHQRNEPRSYGKLKTMSDRAQSTSTQRQPGQLLWKRWERRRARRCAFDRW